MGAKFGSLHVLGATAADVKSIIKSAPEPETPSGGDPTMDALAEAFSNNMFARLARLLPETYYLYDDGRGVHIYSEVLRGGFGSSLLSWFSDHDGYSVSVGCFDEDFLEVAIAQGGRVVTRLVAGEGADFYGKYNARLSPGIVSDVFGVCADELDAVCDTDDLVELAERLGDLLGLPMLPQGAYSGSELRRMGSAVRRWNRS